MKIELNNNTVTAILILAIAAMVIALAYIGE